MILRSRANTRSSEYSDKQTDLKLSEAQPYYSLDTQEGNFPNRGNVGSMRGLGGKRGASVPAVTVSAREVRDARKQLATFGAAHWGWAHCYSPGRLSCAITSDLKLMRNAISAFQADTTKYPGSLADLAETDKTKVKDSSGTVVNANDWHGPYLETVPNDPISGAALTYTAATGKVASSATGNGLDGTAYTTW